MQRSRRWSAGAARGADHRPAGRLVRHGRAPVAGRRGRRRERRLLVALRPSAPRLAALRRRRRDARGANRARLAAIGDRILARGARARARLRPALSRSRPRDRFLRGRAAPAARRGRSHRRADAGRGHDGQGELDPRQRLVRQLRQAGDDAHALAEAFAIDLDAERERVRLRRRLAERRADVRLFSARGRRRQRAGLRRPIAALPATSRGRGGAGSRSSRMRCSPREKLLREPLHDSRTAALQGEMRRPTRMAALVASQLHCAERSEAM